MMKLVLTGAIIVFIALTLQLFQMQARVSKLETADRSQNDQIVGLVGVAEGQQKVLKGSVSLLSTVVGNQKRLVALLSKHRRAKVKQRQLASR